MILPFTDGLIRTNHFDPEMAMLADRHYSRRTVGARQFCYSGRKIVLRNAEGTVLFVWMYPDQALRMDNQVGYNCAIFRNESPRRASEIILEAETFAVERWGPNRAYTFVDARKIRGTRQPGRCFLKAGWNYCGRTKSGKHILEKRIALADVRLCSRSDAMMVIPVEENKVLCVIEPGNIRRLKEGKPWSMKLPNGSEWMIAFTPDMAAFVSALGLDTEISNPPKGEMRQVEGLHLTPERIEQALKESAKWPEVER